MDGERDCNSLLCPTSLHLPPPLPSCFLAESHLLTSDLLFSASSFSLLFLVPHLTSHCALFCLLSPTPSSPLLQFAPPPDRPSLSPSLHHLLCQGGTGGSSLLRHSEASWRPGGSVMDGRKRRSGRKRRKRPTEGCDFLERWSEREQQVLRFERSERASEMFLSPRQHDIISCPRTGSRRTEEPAVCVRVCEE